MKYELQSLSYPYSALEPYIDGRTMEIHHTQHHQAYIDKTNAVLDKHPDLADKPLEDLLASLDSLGIDDADKTQIRNHGGGHLNHALFWEIMGPDKDIDASLTAELETAFGSVEEFKKQFAQAAVGQFGSGWAWLARDQAGSLKVYALPNQDSPYLKGHTPLIGLDVWEHAYYLAYQNRRSEYIENWWRVLKLIP